jgi:hypothetical protein
MSCRRFGLVEGPRSRRGSGVEHFQVSLGLAGVDMVVEDVSIETEASRGWHAQTAGVLVLSVRPKAAPGRASGGGALGCGHHQGAPAGRSAARGMPEHEVVAHVR